MPMLDKTLGRIHVSSSWFRLALCSIEQHDNVKSCLFERPSDHACTHVPVEEFPFKDD